MFFSVSLPEKLEHFANKYGEHLHEKWSAEKVRLEVVLIFFNAKMHLYGEKLQPGISKEH